MLGDLLYEETGTVSGVRVLSSDPGETKIEVCYGGQGRVLGVQETTMWTYWSKTSSDGSMYGEGQGLMTTKDGDVIHMLGSGASKGPGPDGTIHYRGAIYFRTTTAKFARLNGAVGVHEYDLDAQGQATVKVWEWK